MKSETEIPFGICACDYVNFFYPFKDIFKDDKAVHLKSDTEACYLNSDDLQDDINKPTFTLSVTGTISVMKANPFKIASGSIISKFMLLTAVKFKGNYRAAESFVMYNVMKLEIPYCRVGTDYFKMINKKNRSGGTDTILKGWKKQEMTEDHTKSIFKVLPKFDDFILIPDNKNFKSVHDNCYNLYHKFPHELHPRAVQTSDIPHTINFLKHIFDWQFDRGLIYFKVLYDHPKQTLPIIVLVSEDNKTGKSTFINFVKMIFGENATSISPYDLTDAFNDTYASKNIILIDETFFEKKNATDKLKFLSTAQYITVSTKFVQKYSIPFFGKIIMCTNKETDFTQIEQKETRFWVRKIPHIKGKRNTNILNDLFNEIPKFLKYLSQMPDVDLTQDRFVFTEDQTATKELIDVKKESQSWMAKELLMQITDFFNNSNDDEFYAAAIDIKNEWFAHDNQVKASYISKVLKNEMDYVVEKNQRYIPFNKQEMGKERVSTPFKFERNVEKLDQ